MKMSLFSRGEGGQDSRREGEGGLLHCMSLVEC
jgi:hypothetical protein